MKVFKKILLIINLLLALGLLISYLSPDTNPNDNSIIPLLGLLFPILLLGNFIIILLWLFVDWKYLIISLVTITLGWEHYYHALYPKFLSPASKNSIEIMSYNISKGYAFRDKDDSLQLKKIERFKEYLSQLSNIHIICLQESNELVENIFSQVYKEHYLYKEKELFPAIFSKHEIVHSGKLAFENNANGCLFIDVVNNHDTLRVYNLHLQSSSISIDADRLTQIAKNKKRNSWINFKNIVFKYTYTSKMRAKQAELIKSHIDNSPYPIIVCGDFNEPIMSYSYHTLKKDLKDAFIEKGSGLGTTYGGSVPMLRIDYILAGKGLKIDKYFSKQEHYSDHYPIIAAVSFEKITNK